MCEENSRRVQEIIEVYHLNKLQQPDHLHYNTKHINSDDDIIDNNNHIITSIQSHENAINRNEESIKEIKEHVYRLEKHLSLEKQTTDVYLNLFNIRLYETCITHKDV